MFLCSSAIQVRPRAVSLHIWRFRYGHRGNQNTLSMCICILNILLGILYPASIYFNFSEFFVLHVDYIFVCGISIWFVKVLPDVYIFWRYSFWTRNCFQGESLSILKKRRRAEPSIMHLSSGRRTLLFEVLFFEVYLSVL